METKRGADVPIHASRVRHGTEGDEGRQYTRHTGSFARGRSRVDGQRRSVQGSLSIHIPIRPRRDVRSENPAGRHGDRSLETRLHDTRAPASDQVAQVPRVSSYPWDTQGHVEYVSQLRREHRGRSRRLRRRGGVAEFVRRFCGIRERPDEPKYH